MGIERHIDPLAIYVHGIASRPRAQPLADSARHKLAIIVARRRRCCAALPPPAAPVRGSTCETASKWGPTISPLLPPWPRIDRTPQTPRSQRLAGPGPLVERLHDAALKPHGGLWLPAEPEFAAGGLSRAGGPAAACHRPRRTLPAEQFANGGYSRKRGDFWSPPAYRRHSWTSGTMAST